MNSSLYTVPRAHPVLSRQWNITLDSVILRHGIPENTQQFFTWLLVLFVEKLTFETHKNTTMGAAILCPAVNISDVTNRTCMCDKNTKTCHEPSPFSSPSPFFSLLCSSVVKTEHRRDINVMADWGAKHQITHLLAEPTWLRPKGSKFEAKKVLTLTEVKRSAQPMGILICTFSKTIKPVL